MNMNMNLPKDIQKDILSYMGHPIGNILKTEPFFKRHLLLQTLNKVSSLPLKCDVNVRFDYQYIYLDYEKQKLREMVKKDEIACQQNFINYKKKCISTVRSFEKEDAYEIEDIRHSLWKRHGMFVGKEWVRENHHRLG